MKKFYFSLLTTLFIFGLITGCKLDPPIYPAVTTEITTDPDPGTLVTVTPGTYDVISEDITYYDATGASVALVSMPADKSIKTMVFASQNATVNYVSGTPAVNGFLYNPDHSVLLFDNPFYAFLQDNNNWTATISTTAITLKNTSNVAGTYTDALGQTQIAASETIDIELAKQ